MGLDLRAYETVKLVKETLVYDPDMSDELRRVWAYPGWESRIEGLAPGYYEVSGKRQHLRVGPYSSYNRWRANLCEMVLKATPNAVWDNQAQYAGKPFVELICFSDCDGVIGPVTSAKLLKDFYEHQGACGHIGDYEEWTEIFKTASNGGAVFFV